MLANGVRFTVTCPDMAEQLLTEQDVARLVNVSTATVAGWRAKGIGPRYIRVERIIRYRRADVEQWIGGEPVSPDEATTGAFIAYAEAMKRLGLHTGVGLPDVPGVFCVVCGRPWPCPDRDTLGDVPTVREADL